jgi:hypothetical protein
MQLMHFLQVGPDATKQWCKRFCERMFSVLQPAAVRVMKPIKPWLASGSDSESEPDDHEEREILTNDAAVVQLLEQQCAEVIALVLKEHQLGQQKKCSFWDALADLPQCGTQAFAAHFLEHRK